MLPVSSRNFFRGIRRAVLLPEDDPHQTRVSGLCLQFVFHFQQR